MKEDISQLREIQAIDLEICRLDTEIAAGTTAVDQRRQSIEGRKTGIEQMQEKIVLIEQRRLELDAELEELQERIKDRQPKLMNIQNNREYQSILKETEDAKKAAKEREDEIVLLMEQIEGLKTKIEEEGNLCGAEETLLDEEMQKIAKQTSKLTTERTKVAKSRDAKACKITASLLKKYNLLRERRNGLAVVAVTSGVCRGCFMNIPPQLYNDLMREDRLICCPTCNRIMFHQAETQEA